MSHCENRMLSLIALERRQGGDKKGSKQGLTAEVSALDSWGSG